MKQVRAVAKYIFDKSFPIEYIKYYSGTCFMSILDCDNNECKYDLAIDNFLQVRMWDIEEDEFCDGVLKSEKPHESKLQEIVDFINKHKDKSLFIVHCSAGISRSGAVARFIYEKFREEIDKERFLRDNKNIMPNIYILNKLKELDGMLK